MNAAVPGMGPASMLIVAALVGVTIATAVYLARLRSKVLSAGDNGIDMMAPKSVKPMVFLVHGQDHNVRDRLDLFLTKELGLDTCVMEEEVGGGLTIPEKFETIASRCAFAIVIITGDDALTDETGKVTIRRARQNVILEIGYFWGRLGREGRIALLVERPKEIELPSDISGLGYIEITDDLAKTKERLRKELKGAGVIQ